MNHPTRYKIIIGVAITLIALNLALLGTIGFRYLLVPNPAHPKPFNQQKGQAFVTKQLNLTPEQQVQFKQFHGKHLRQSKELRNEIRQTQQLVADELGAAPPRREVLDSLSRQLGALHTQMQQATIDHFLQLRQVCTPEQQIQMKKLLARMMRHNPMMQDRPHERSGKQRNRGNSENNF